MRIINVRVDDLFFEKMRKDKFKREIETWEKYLRFLFNKKKEAVKNG